MTPPIRLETRPVKKVHFVYISNLANKSRCVGGVMTPPYNTMIRRKIYENRNRL